MEVKSVGVIGAGQMGAGIAQVCAAIDKKVILCDIKQEFVDSLSIEMARQVLIRHDQRRLRQSVVERNQQIFYSVK